VRGLWEDLPVERRHELLSRMSDIADDDPELDFNAMFRLGLHDPDSDIRIQAVEGLWECQDRWLIDELIELMQDDPEDEVRSTAASNLGKFALLGELEEILPRDSERVRTALLAQIKRDGETLEVRRRAVEAISPYSDDEINDLIREAYYHADLKMRASALYAMGVHCDPAWLPVLLKELKSPEAELRYEAARACGEMEDERAVSALAEIVRDEDLQVRTTAIEALGRIGGNAARRLLRRLVTDQDETIREAAREALEELESFENPLSFNNFRD
jgi:HEAT repeat protein